MCAHRGHGASREPALLAGNPANTWGDPGQVGITPVPVQCPEQGGVCQLDSEWRLRSRGSTAAGRLGPRPGVVLRDAGSPGASPGEGTVLPVFRPNPLQEHQDH